MSRKLTLIKPEVRYPVKKQGYSGDVGMPLGLLYLAAYVREQNGTDVSIVDYRLKRVQGIERRLEEDITNADIVGITACTAEAPDAIHIARKAKAMGKEVVMGGLFPTFNAETLLRTRVADYIVLGEGETGLSGLLRALDKKESLATVSGIMFNDNGSIVKTPNKELIADLNTLPMPAYDLIPMAEYAKYSPAGVYASRGCPLTCKFCTLNELWEYKQRTRSFDNIIAELALLREFGFRRVHFKDETITLNRKWCNELFVEIEKANLGMIYKAKSRINGVSEEGLKQMMSAGLDTIHTGIESISQRMLNGMAKRVNADAIRRSMDIMISNGCQVNPVYLFGWIGETPKDLAENARFIEEVGTRKGVITYMSFITPHPGSEFERDPTMRNNLRVVSHDYARYTHKQPVAVPYSLGENGIRLMVDQYHRLAEVCGMQDVNPRIEQSYLESILPEENVKPLEWREDERRCEELAVA